MDVGAKKAQLKAQFRKMDKNGDNRLDFAEFLVLMPGLDNQSAHKLFEKVDESGDGTIDFDEFVDYIYSSSNSRSTAGRHMRLAAASAVDSASENDALWDNCLVVYETYMGLDKKFENRDFMKLCGDCKLFDRKFKKNDVDLIFTKFKPRGQNKIDFEAFKNCIRAIGQKKGLTTAVIQACVAERENIGVESSATKADFVRFHDDKTTYTGMHTANEFHGSGGGADHNPNSRHERIKTSSAYSHNEGEELDWSKVQDAFTAFCEGDAFMQAKEFLHLCTDCQLFVRGKFAQADVDIIFNKVKNRGERKIDFDQFKDACIGVAQKRGGPVSEVQRAIMQTGGPQLHGVTQADAVRFHDDKSLYTGTHAVDY